MTPLIVEPTEITPGIKLNANANQFEMWGESRPENARKFFQPVIDWFDAYNKSLYYLKNESGDNFKKDIEMVFSFDYLNSTSIKFVYDILKKLEELKSNCTSLAITWYYESGDDDMKESGEEFSKMVNLNFNIKSK